MLIMIVNLITPVRAIDEHQRAGLDHAEHSEVGYPEFQSAGLHQ
jgi:ammonia channel protein AmtB